MSTRRAIAYFTVFLIALAISSPARAQSPGQNVNMVAGTTWPGGDPHLQRQNEGSLAVSSRNPLHLLGGGNDYRTVDLPGLAEEGATGDAWNGLFKSINGGGRWFSTLVPGYPQDQSPEGLASPLKGYQAAADAYVRSSTHGLFYYGGLVFNRGDNQPSAIYVARYIDRNNKENGDPIGYLGTSIVASDNGENFLDKPTIAVGPPGGQFAATCNIDGHVVKSGPLYAVWTLFPGDNHPHNQRTDLDQNGNPTPPLAKIIFSKSLDCGATWSAQYRLETVGTNQGASIAVDPRNGVIYVAWRRFKGHGKFDEIIVTSSTTGGRTWRAKRSLPIYPFDQGTTGTSFRTNAYPTIAVDHRGLIYVAWASRGFAQDAPDRMVGDSRIVISVGFDHRNYSMPRAVDNFFPGRGHQIMPAIATAGGRVQLVYYDFREDVSGFFQQFVDELAVLTSPSLPRRRHTVDVRSAQAPGGPNPQFTSYAVNPVNPSQLASQYLIGSRPTSPDLIEQLQFNPPNLPIFAGGTVPFIGDYTDIGHRQFVPGRNADGSERWDHNGNDAPIFHLVWADNRDVRPPADGNWRNYTPINLGGPSIYDPNVVIPPCVPGQAGMRNQNLYTSRVTPGLVAASPGNEKPLSGDLTRAFVVYAQNTTDELALYRFSIRNQPPGGKASFVQSFPDAVPPVDPPAVTQLDVLVQPRSSAARTVFVTSSDPNATVFVDIVQIAGMGAPPPPPGGRGATVVLNPDITNPDITNPDITNPDITNPDITNAEAYNPDITNPDITNPDITNPDITNPDITNPDITNINVANPDITNPDITNPDITNPDITNPDITNPDITNADIDGGEVNDFSYTAENQGNTSSQYFVDLETTDPVPGAIKTQFIIHRIYQTPVADGCNLKQQTQNQVILNLPNPFDSTDLISFWLEPGEKIKLTFRVVDTDGPGGETYDPTKSLDISVSAAAVNTEDAAEGSTTPPSTSATPPVAVPDAFAFETATFEVAAPGILGNDTFGTVTPVLVTPPAYAQAFALGSDGSFSYVPNGDFPGTDTFTYFLQSGTLHSATVPVTIAGPIANQDPWVVVNTNDSGPGSLRNAIEYANGQDGGITIIFAIPNGEGPIFGPDRSPNDPEPEGPVFHRIELDTLLPPVTTNMTIDGTTQPGYPGTPLVIVDGSNVELACYEEEMGGEEICEEGYGLSITSGDSTVRGLAIVESHGPGIALSGGDYNDIKGNWIGIDPSTGGAAGNEGAGIAITGNSNFNLIGVECNWEGPPADPADRNVISGNAGDGVSILNGNSTRICGNYIGTNAAGGSAVSNERGVSIANGSSNSWVGGPLEHEGNLISGNRSHGVLVWTTEEANPDNTRISGNRIGAGVNGEDLGNGGAGIHLADVVAVLIGGYSYDERNEIAGNDGPGVQIFGGSGHWVYNSLIGVYDDDGFVELPNAKGVEIVDSWDNVIGVKDYYDTGNQITGNTLHGVDIRGGGTSNIVRGNRIGHHYQDGNRGSGIWIGAPDTIIGGSEYYQANEIWRNQEDGIFVGEGSNGTQILGNQIGTDGYSGYGNVGWGVHLVGASGVQIGGSASGEGNLIGTNQSGGILLYTSDGNTILNNQIGGEDYYEGTLGNGGPGVALIGSSQNTVGGVSSGYPYYDNPGNRIAFNDGSGILVESVESEGEFELFIAAVDNQFLGNLIYSNDMLSIDLVPVAGEQNENDEDDGDFGANRLQNTPVIDWIGHDGDVLLSGSLDGEGGEGSAVRIEFFLSRSCATGGAPTADVFLGVRELTTDSEGDVPFDFNFSFDLLEGNTQNGIVATATFTLSEGGPNTSELSTCISLWDFSL